MKNNYFLLTLFLAIGCVAPKAHLPQIRPPEPPQENQAKDIEPNFEFSEFEVVQNPKQDGLSANCIYLNGVFIGETKLGLKSREKTWATRLPPGNHLMEFQRWFFPGDSLWIKAKNNYQPRKRFIRVKENSKTNVSIKYFNSGKKYTFKTKKNALSPGSTAQLEVMPIEYNTPRFSFCPLSPNTDETSFSSFWTKKRNVEIFNTGSNLRDQQIELTIPYDSDMAPDFGDLRFFTSNGSELSYWIEQFSESEKASVLIRLPLIPSSGMTLTMYYGNPDAMAKSNPVETMLDYEDFNDFEGWDHLAGSSNPKLIDDGALSRVEIKGDETEDVLFCRELPRKNPISIDVRIKILQAPFGFVFLNQTTNTRYTTVLNYGEYNSDSWETNDGEKEELNGPGMPLNKWGTIAFNKDQDRVTIQRPYAGRALDEKSLAGPVDSFCLAIPEGQGISTLDFVHIKKSLPTNVSISLGEEMNRAQ